MKNFRSRALVGVVTSLLALAAAAPAALAIIVGADRIDVGNGVVVLGSELATNAGVTAGTTRASKTLVVDANKSLDTLSLVELKLGASGSGVALTTTGTQLNQITSSYGTVNFDRSTKVARVALTNSGTGILNWQNPESTAILVTRLVVDITTQSSVGGATADFGVGTTGASNDTLIDGLALDATGTSDNITNKGSNGLSVKKVAATTGFVTGTASGTPTALVGFAYISYHRI